MASIRTQREIRQRAPLYLVMLLFTNLVIMAVDARDDVTKQRMFRVWAQAVFSPVQNFFASVAGASSRFVRKIVNFNSTAQENERLQERMAQLETQLKNTQDVQAENDRLRDLLGLKQQTEMPNVTARVIARDSSAWFNTVIINRGSSAGIQLNMPVVTHGGLVGRVVALSPWTAQVMLLTDEKAAAGAVVGKLGQSGAMGSIGGTGEHGLIEMRYVSGLQQVNVGDFVLTTGQDGIYPPDLNVGEIVDVKQGTATQPHQILIRPGARLDQLEEVMVLLYQPPQRPPLEQTLPNVDKGRK